MREFRIGEEINLKPGDKIGLNSFQVGDRIKISSISKGKGFQGVVKRYGFRASKATHGNKDQSRMPGSIGATGPAHVFKGTRMGGHMGDERSTIKNLEIVEVDLENGIIAVKGALPGAKNGLLMLSAEGVLKITKDEPKVEEKQKNLDSDRLYFAAGSSERKALERWEDENLAGPLFPCPFLGAVREELQLQKL